MIFDTHAHYDDEAFEEDRGALIASLAEQGIGRVVNVAADLASVSTSLTLAQQYPFIYAAVGVHPVNCHVTKGLGAASSNPRAKPRLLSKVTDFKIS